MRSTGTHGSISVQRAEALFASQLQPSQRPGARQVQQAVEAAIHRFGEGECAARVAEEFGEHPETAAARMRWAREAIGDAYRRPGLPAAWRHRPGHPEHLPVWWHRPGRTEHLPVWRRRPEQLAVWRHRLGHDSQRRAA